MQETQVISTVSAATGNNLVSLLAQHPERGWELFIERYTDLILFLLRRWGVDYDQVMDQFVYICDKLCAEDYRRLKMIHYAGNGDLDLWVRVVVKHFRVNWLWSVKGRNRPPQAIARLPAFEQCVFELYFWKGSSPSEIYEELSCTHEFATEFDQVFEALERIFSCLSHQRHWRLLSHLARRQPMRSINRMNGETSPRPEPVDARPTPEGALLQKEREALLQRALDHLSPKERVMIKLRYAEDMSLKDIGERLHLSKYQVKRSLRATLDKLRIALDGCRS